MKNILLILIFSFTTSLVYSQNNLDNFIGYWEGDTTTARLVIWKDKFENPQVVIFNTFDGDVFEILGFWIEKNTLHINHNIPKRDWKFYGSYVMISDTKMRCDYKNNQGEGQLFYTKIK